MYKPYRPSWSIISLFLVLSMVLASCSRGAPSASTPTPGTSMGDKTIITFGGYEYQRRMYEPLMEAFTEQNPDIIVQFVDLNQALSELYSGEQEWNPYSYYRGMAQAADTFLMSGYFSTDMTRYFRNLQPLYEADPNFQGEDFWPGILSACEDPYGNQVGLPLNATITGIFYDPAAFDAVRLPYPQPGWTFDDFQSAVSALTEKKGADIRYGFYDQPYLFGSILMPFVMNHLEKNGGEVVAAELLREIQWYVDLVKADMLVGIKDQEAMETDWEQRMKLFEKEETRPAMWSDSLISYLPTGYTELDSTNPFSGTTLDSFGFVPIPVSADASMTQTSMSWVECASISAGSTNPRAAWAWLNFLSRQWLVMDKNQIYEMSRAPSRQSVAADNGYWDLIPAKAVPAVRYALAHSFFQVSDFEYVGDINVALGKWMTGKGDFEAELAQSIASRPPTPTPPPDNAPIVVATPMPPLAEGTRLVKYYINSYNMNELTALKALVDQFNQRQTDVQVRLATEFHGEPDEDWFVGMTQSFDCFTTNAPYWEYMDASNLLNLNSLMSSEPASFSNDFLPQMLEKYRLEGNLYGIPSTTQVQMIAYNMDLLARRNLPMPDNNWTFDEFIQLASAVASTSDSDPSYGYMFSPYDDFFLNGRGVKWADFESNPPKALFDSPEWSSYLNWLAGLAANRTIFNQDEDWMEMEKVFTQGQLAFWTSMMGEKNSWFYAPGQESTQRIGMVPVPQTTGPNPMTSWTNDRGHYISAKSQEAQVCWSWIKFLSEQPTVFSGLPARRSVAESPAWEASVGQTDAAAYRAAIENAKPYDPSSTATPGYVWPIYNWRAEAVRRALIGELDQAYLVSLQQKAEAFLSCAQTLPSEDTSPEYGEDVMNCARQADPEGNW
jgi:ABC-type glycerol-3-phosphate transport system substrate-binding protein